MCLNDYFLIKVKNICITSVSCFILELSHRIILWYTSFFSVSIGNVIKKSLTWLQQGLCQPCCNLFKLLCRIKIVNYILFFILYYLLLENILFSCICIGLYASPILTGPGFLFKNVVLKSNGWLYFVFYSLLSFIRKYLILMYMNWALCQPYPNWFRLFI